MKDLIKIGIPSKGRLRKDVLNIFKKNKLKLISSRGDRDLIGSIKGKQNIEICLLYTSPRPRARGCYRMPSSA